MIAHNRAISAELSADEQTVWKLEVDYWSYVDQMM